MFSTEDTIVAIATPLGRSGIGLVRLSGPQAAQVACALVGRSRPLQPRRATFARLATSVPGSDLRPQPARTPWQNLPSRSGTVPGVETAESLDKMGPEATSNTAQNLRARAGTVPIGDQVIVTFFPQPNSYTGDHVAEVSAHGSPVVLQGILHLAIAAGARLAEPGEFTLRAFLNGKLDLIQAEAVADLINAVTPLQARAAFDQLEGTLTAAIRTIEAELFDLMARLEASLDFPDEGYHFVAPNAAAQEIETVRARINQLLVQSSRGRLIREGAQIAILGTPNVGKSSLFNALLNANRAIVTAIPGTTRDLLTERADIGGVSVGLIDTAGIRPTTDVVEQEGVSRARQAAAIADLTLLVLDASRALTQDDRALLEATASRAQVVVINKTDLPTQWPRDLAGATNVVEISARTGAGLDALSDRITHVLGTAPESRDQPAITNVRHITLLENARAALDRATGALSSSNDAISEEFLLADLQDAARHLQEITGRRTTDDLLRHIFERFCIGK